MLCDHCGGKVTPVFVCDIDGTIADYYSHFLKFLSGYWHKPFPDNWDGTGNWEDYLGLSQDRYRQAKLAYRQGGMKRNLPLYASALWFIDEVEKMGVDIWFATARPSQSLSNIDPDTQFWISSCGWNVKGLIFGEDKYHQLLGCVDKDRIIGVLDDLGENLQVAHNLGLPTFQVARRHNSGAGLKWERRGTLADALTWLRTNLQDWQKENA